jgi:hypothetical protein
VDRAIEWAEDELLGPSTEPEPVGGELMNGDPSLLREFTPDHIRRLRPYLEYRQWPADSIIFKRGDPGSDLFLVTRGHASVRLPTKDGDIRLATFAPGTAFGERRSSTIGRARPPSQPTTRSRPGPSASASSTRCSCVNPLSPSWFSQRWAASYPAICARRT